MQRFLRRLSIFLLLFTAINAIIAGILFILDPSGQIIGMSIDYLKFSPFSSFLIPGIVLLIVNGILNLGVAIITIQQKPFFPLLTIIQGILLIGWIVIQVLMVRDINPLHIIMFLIGMILILNGVLLGRNLNRKN